MPSISTTSPPNAVSVTRDNDELNCKSRDNEKSRGNTELDSYSKSRESKQEQAEYYYSWVHSHIIKYQTPALQGQKFVAVGAESRYLADTATNRDI